MSVRNLRKRVKSLKDQVAPAAVRTQFVLVRPDETDDQALARLGINRDECDLRFVHGISEDDERL